MMCFLPGIRIILPSNQCRKDRDWLFFLKSPISWKGQSHKKFHFFLSSSWNLFFFMRSLVVCMFKFYLVYLKSKLIFSFDFYENVYWFAWFDTRPLVLSSSNPIDREGFWKLPMLLFKGLPKAANSHIDRLLKTSAQSMRKSATNYVPQRLLETRLCDN